MARTELKLLEAKFFLKHLEEHWRHVLHVDFYLSAFISAARSVTWVMKAEYGRVAGWSQWYDSKKPSAEVRAFLRKLNDVRVRSEKSSPLSTQVTATLRIPPDQVTPELKDWLTGGSYQRFRLIPTDKSNTQFDIVDGTTVLARGVLQSAQHELPEFPNEDSLAVCRRYLALLEPLVGECILKFSLTKKSSRRDETQRPSDK